MAAGHLYNNIILETSPKRKRKASQINKNKQSLAKLPVYLIFLLNAEILLRKKNPVCIICILAEDSLHKFLS